MLHGQPQSNAFTPKAKFPHNIRMLVLSKDYLSQLPANKSLIADQIYKSIVADVFNAAVSGKTSYTYDLVKLYINTNRFMHPMGMMAKEKNTSYTSEDLPLINTPLVISNEELVSQLQVKFPDCKVSYVGNETMPDYSDNNNLGMASHNMMQPGYVVPNGILIDWS